MKKKPELKRIKILLTEDHNVVRKGIRALLEKVPEFEIVGEVSNGLEALSFLKEHSSVIDLIFVDMNMPEMNGTELIGRLRADYPQIKILVLSMLDHEKYIYEALSAGACGYLLKNVSADEMIFAVKHIKDGGKYLCSELSFNLLERKINGHEVVGAGDLDLSKREIEVLDLIAEGLTNVEIADKLFTSKRTVEGHRLSLMNKTNSKNSSALIKFAVLNGIIS